MLASSLRMQSNMVGLLPVVCRSLCVCVCVCVFVCLFVCFWGVGVRVGFRVGCWGGRGVGF